MKVMQRPTVKKALCVATAVTGCTTGAAAMAPSSALASTKNYELNVHYSDIGVWDFFVCGYNQNNKWVCSNDFSNLIQGTTGMSNSRTIPNWWFHGKVRLWWDGQRHHASCTLPAQFTSGNWTSIWANSSTAFDTGSGNCNNSIGY